MHIQAKQDTENRTTLPSRHRIRQLRLRSLRPSMSASRNTESVQVSEKKYSFFRTIIVYSVAIHPAPPSSRESVGRTYKLRRDRQAVLTTTSAPPPRPWILILKCELTTYHISHPGDSHQTQNICITFIQRRPNVKDVGPTSFKCYTNILCLLIWTLMRLKPFYNWPARLTW